MRDHNGGRRGRDGDRSIWKDGDGDGRNKHRYGFRMIRWLIVLQDEVGNKRLVPPGPVVLSPGEKPVGMEATKEYAAELKKCNQWAGYKFKTCLTCKRDGVYDHT